MSQPTELAIRHEDVEAALARLRSYSDKVIELTGQAERDSMSAAADMTLVYEAREWLKDRPPARNRYGRPVPGDTPAKFAEWVAEHPERIGKAYSAGTDRVQQLLAAHAIAVSYFDGVEIASDSTLRSLRTFHRKRPEELPDIARRVRQISEGRPVTEVVVRRAIHDHNQAVRPPQTRAARGERRTPEMEIRTQFRLILAAGRLRDASRLLIELRDELLAAQHESP